MLFYNVFLVNSSPKAFSSSSSSTAKEFSATYKCPTSASPQSLNDTPNNNNFDVYIHPAEASSFTHLQQFKDQKIFDGWQTKYSNFKDQRRPFVENFIIPRIKSHYSIYESACGQGMNLLLTAEILREHDIAVTLSGSDYLQTSVDLANQMLDTPEAQKLTSKGTFCQGGEEEVSIRATTKLK